jgi:polyisoprenoid-binding protein YceI
LSTLPTPGVYVVDPLHSNVDFVARHLVAAKVRGHFSEFEGTITIGDSIESSTVEATVQASSISTGNEMRDAHLQSADFLELEKFPTLTLKSTKITAKGGDDYVMTADLTIHGVTKSIDFDLEYLGTGPSMQAGASVAGFEAKGEFDRRDYGVNFEGALENGILVVGNKIVVQITVEAHEKTETAA